ncbi:LD-carboxypeptidase [Sporomusa aerivorans]|uniref:S66 peptidase family protein n=1 Tax=Sporomusa aerivorans TaxID=204936 RepID=UPI003529E916
MNSIPRIKPRRLKAGATLGVLAPASPGAAEFASAGVQYLTAQGFQIRLGKSVNQEEGYLSGTDALRAADINNMFADPAIDGIICLRGGYGTMRLLELLNYELIKKNPKIFMGYSDITALHTSIGQRTGLVTFHGPMVASDMGKDFPDYSADYLWRALTLAGPLGPIANPLLSPAAEFISPGTANGCLTGGNLTLLAATLGTPYEIDTCGKILCLEEVGEAPYRIDRLLTQLLLAGKLQAAAGIVFDVCADCDAEAKPPSFTVEEVLRDRLGGLNKPVLINLHFGHTAEKATLPFGVMATLEEQSGLIITETATEG